MIDLLLLQMPCPCSGGKSRPLLWFGLFAIAWLLAVWIGPKFDKKGNAAMKTRWKVALVVALAAAIVAVLALKQRDNDVDLPPTEDTVSEVATPTGETPATGNAVESKKALPRLVDLGADKCIPCKKMMPILEELKTTYAGQFQVDFIDVWKNPTAGEQYGVKMIPTQVFYDASGQERFRHMGFFSKEDILATWKELGVELTEQP